MFLVSIFSCGNSSKKNKFQVTNDDFCKDSVNVLRIVEDTLTNIHGGKVEDYKPLILKYSNDSIWIVYGIPPDSIIGGGVYVEIQKSNCEILSIMYGK